MITHLELDILECEVKWALGSITTNKASGGDGISVELFQIQRIARRNKKAFLNEQCKETEGNSRMGRTRDLSKNIGAIKGTIHARIGTIKDRNSKDLTEANEIKRKW